MSDEKVCLEQACRCIADIIIERLNTQATVLNVPSPVQVLRYPQQYPEYEMDIAYNKMSVEAERLILHTVCDEVLNIIIDKEGQFLLGDSKRAEEIVSDPK